MMKRSRKKYQRLFVVALFMGCCLSHGQTLLSANQHDYPKLPQERIFVHYNTTLLLAGEYLYYKVYNLNTRTRGLSTISKIAYVELIGEDKKQVFKHKVLLSDSMGQGDFFIPTSVPSGNYKLVAYTQWMKNGSKSKFFQGDIAIINPYQANQEKILAQADSLLHQQAVEQQAKAKQELLLETSDQNISVVQDQKTYHKRSIVSLDFKSLINEGVEGSYSLSVRKVDMLAKPERPTFKTYYLNTRQWISGAIPKDSDFYPPELRGELLHGKVTALDSTSPVAQVDVVISIPGETGYEMKLVTTNAEGLFFVNLEKEYSGNQATCQVLGPSRKNYKIEVGEQAVTENWDLTFSNFEMIPEMKEMIIEKSVHNQIENGYFSIKPDSIKPTRNFVLLDTGRMFTYNLDDYTRFPTIRETIVEIIDQVWARRMGRGEYAFQVQPYRDDLHVDPNMLPLVLVDGVPIQNHTHLLGSNARNFKRISFIRDKYVVGSKIFQGVLSLETFKGDYVVPYDGDYKIIVDLFKPEPQKRYFQQSYGVENPTNTDRLLDFRYQLLWEPNFILDGDNTSLVFYTSDVSGYFEVCLEGFTEQGKAITMRKLFEVEP